jgi:hypothetical protein
MNYRAIANSLIDQGYLKAKDGSKVHRVGLKVMKRRNMQACGIHVKDLGVMIRRDPAWLKAYSL